MFVLFIEGSRDRIGGPVLIINVFRNDLNDKDKNNGKIILKKNKKFLNILKFNY